MADKEENSSSDKNHSKTKNDESITWEEAGEAIGKGVIGAVFGFFFGLFK